MNIADWITRHAGFQPDKPAIVFGDRLITYAVLESRIRETASTLRRVLRVGRGDRLAWLGYNHPDSLILLFACARIGAILTPLNWRLTAAEISYIVQDAGANLLFTDGKFESECAEVAASVPGLRVLTLSNCGGESAGPAEPESGMPHVGLGTPLLVVYTSGTTGHPKGAVLKQQALLSNALMSVHMHDMREKDIVLTILPMFHVGGLNIQTTPALYCGATVVLRERFEPRDCLLALNSFAPTLTVLVPATLQAVLAEPGWLSTDLGSLRSITTGSSVVPLHLIDAVESRGVRMLQVYGSTETCPIAAYQKLGDPHMNHRSTGRSGLHCEIRVVGGESQDLPAGERGEVLVRGDNVMFEYWGNESATEEAFYQDWFRTGDIGHMDEQGRLYIDDRAKDVIISGGENIYPAEVERVLHKHDAITDVALIGALDARWGEVPVAFCQCRYPVDETELLGFCATELARFKLPRRFEFVDEFPRNSLGKIQKFKLREVLNQGVAKPDVGS